MYSSLGFRICWASRSRCIGFVGLRFGGLLGACRRPRIMVCRMSHGARVFTPVLLYCISKSVSVCLRQTEAKHSCNKLMEAFFSTEEAACKFNISVHLIGHRCTPRHLRRDLFDFPNPVHRPFTTIEPPLKALDLPDLRACWCQNLRCRLALLSLHFEPIMITRILPFLWYCFACHFLYEEPFPYYNTRHHNG